MRFVSEGSLARLPFSNASAIKTGYFIIDRNNLIASGSDPRKAKSATTQVIALFFPKNSKLL